MTSLTRSPLFWITLAFFAWMMTAVFGSGCATFTSRGPSPRQGEASIRPCARQQFVSFSPDFPELAKSPVLNAMRQWNEAAGYEALVETTVALDGDPLAWISIDTYFFTPQASVPGMEIMDKDAAEITNQLVLGGCAVGAKIRIGYNPEMHPKTIEYSAKHGLGHALGLNHSWHGVMRSTRSFWLPDYVVTGGRIDQDSVEMLREVAR